MAKKALVLSIIEKKKSALEDTLSKIAGLNNQVPVFQKMLDTTNWELNVIEKIPENIVDGFRDETENLITIAGEYLEYNLPQIHQVYSSVSTSGLALSASGSAAIFHETVGLDDTLFPQKYLSIDKYYDMQKKQENPKDISDKLSLFSPNIVKYFDDAIDSILEFYAGTKNISVTAGEMRTFLEKFKGELFNKSPNCKNASHSTKWGIMSEELARKNVAKFEELVIKGEEETYNKLHIKLTNLFKKNITMNPDEFRLVESEFISHIYAIINLIDDNYFSQP